MASSSLATEVQGCCLAKIRLQNRDCNEVEMSRLPNLCTDVILGLPFLKSHKSLTLSLGGDEPGIEIRGLTRIKNSTPQNSSAT